MVLAKKKKKKKRKWYYLYIYFFENHVNGNLMTGALVC